MNSKTEKTSFKAEESIHSETHVADIQNEGTISTRSSSENASNPTQASLNPANRAFLASSGVMFARKFVPKLMVKVLSIKASHNPSKYAKSSLINDSPNMMYSGL